MRVDELYGKISSTRLSEDELLYVLKYAEKHKTKNMSDTLRAIINQMMQLENLDDMKYQETAFSKPAETAKEKDLDLDFFKRTPRTKKVIAIDAEPLPSFDERKPEPEPTAEAEPEDNDNDEEVFVL